MIDLKSCLPKFETHDDDDAWELHYLAFGQEGAIYFQKFALHLAALIGLTALAVALRVAGLGASAIWYDESFSLAMARLPLLDLVRAAALDFNPPLWEMIAWVSTRLFGDSAIGLRLPSLVASIAAFVVAACLVHELAPGLGGYVGLVAVAVLPYQLWVAQDGRVYAVMSLLYLTGARFALRGRWLGLTAVLGLLLYSLLPGVVYAAPLVVLAFVANRKSLRTLALSLLCAALSFVPWLSTWVNAANRDFWLGPFTWGGLLTALARAFFVDALPSALWGTAAIAIVGGVAGAVVITLTERARSSLTLAVLAIGPLACMVAISQFRNVVFYRPLSALTIPLVLWLTVTLTRTRLPWRWLKYTAATVWGVLLLAGLLSWSPASKGGDLRALADRIMLDAMRPGDVVYHATGTSALPFGEYVRAPTYLLNEEQPPGLLSQPMQDALGLKRAALEDVPYARAWIVWALDDQMTDAARMRMTKYIEGGTLIGTVRYWQAAPIQVWLVEHVDIAANGDPRGSPKMARAPKTQGAK